MKREEIANEFRRIQAEICTALEKEDGIGLFQSDIWERAEGGGGDSRVLQNGKVLEKAGVNFSEVYGPVTGKMKDVFDFGAQEFYATGVSIVMHPQHPLCPIIHMNIRYFELAGQKWWFGGGIDLTPIYVDEAEGCFFHQQLKATCDRFNASYYTDFKNWADDYFYIPHRKESRGIGGIFFDKLNTGGTKEELFEFVTAVGRTFAPAYTHILKQKKDLPFTADHKKWQAVRRSRYVEFNLVYDRGTKFGLETDGRVESILMSMPPQAEWPYNHKPFPGSAEAQTLGYLQTKKAWI